MQTNFEQFTNQLMQALQMSMNPSPDSRKQAEQFIIESQRQPGYMTSLLAIASNKQVEPATALAAAVQLGTLVEYHWKFKDEQHAQKVATKGFNFVILAEEDKSQVRQCIVQRMYECENEPILKQLDRSVKHIARIDYPERWPTLITHNIPELLRMENEKAVYTGLMALLALVSKYEYDQDEEREPLYAILNQAHEMLGKLIGQLMQHTQNQLALKILHKICKIFYVANQLILAPMFMDTQSEILTAWMNFFDQVLQLEVPQEMCCFTEDQDAIEARDGSIYWKIKGMASKITYRLFCRYGNPDTTMGTKLEQFGQYFQSKFNQQFLGRHLTMMLERKSSFVGTKCLNFNMRYVCYAIKIKPLMAVLKPYIDNILYETAIPIMLPSQRDVALFHEDPIEYIRKQEDITETLYMPKNTLIDLIQYICKYKSNKKGKQDYLIPFLTYAKQNMEQYQALAAQNQTPDWRIKEALMTAVGFLEGEISQEKATLGPMMEPLMATHVLPELSSGHPMLRARANWLYGEFSAFKFTDDNHIKQAIDGVYQSLFAAELPVRFQACIALSQLLKVKTARDFLNPALGKILEVFLKTITEFDSETLLKAFETIMGKYGKQMGPYAVQICQQLVTQYQRLVQVDCEEDDGEAALASIGCVTAIKRLIDSCSKDKTVLMQLQEIVYPILMHGLTPDGLDAIEDGLDCLTTLLYHGGNVTPHIWRLYPQMLHICAGNPGDVDGGYAFEYLSATVTCVQNFIAKDPNTFLTQVPDPEQQGATYADLTLRFLQQVLVINSNSASKVDGIVAMKVFLTVFENLAGRIDHILPRFLEILLAELKVLLSKKKPIQNYLSMLLQAIALSFFNSPAVTFHTCEANQMTGFFFQAWLEFMPKFTKEFELRRVIFGLIGVLRCPPEQYPQLVQMKISTIFQTCAELVCKQYRVRLDSVTENEKQIKEEQEALAKNDGFQSDHSGGDSMDADDDSMDDDEDFIATKKALGKFKNGEMDSAEGDDSEDDSDDSDYEFNGGDMGLYDSNLDEMDELRFMRDTVQTLMQTNQMLAQAMIGSYDTAALFEALGQVDTLKAREEAALKLSDELFDDKFRN